MAVAEKDFIGMRIKNKIGGYFEILPWDGERVDKGNIKVYPIYCPICSEDKELFPDKLKVRKGDALGGKVPCGCSHKFRYTKLQLETLVKRFLEGTSLEFRGFNGKYKVGHTKLNLYCTKHKTISSNYTFSHLKAGSYGCNSCANEKVSSSKLKTDETFINSFNASGAFPEGTTFTRDLVSTDHQGYYRYWYVTCPTCSNDKFVKAGLCSGIFHALTGCLQRGNKPCRCSTNSGLTRAQAEFEIKEEMNKIGYIFIGWLKGEYSCKLNFTYLCNDGHTAVSNHHKFITMGYRCKHCRAYGYMEARADFEDYLYFITLTRSTEDFVKVGRTFDINTRFKEFSKEYTVKVNVIITDKHSLIFPLEQEIFKVINRFHYRPKYWFGGATDECFSLSATEGIEWCLNIFRGLQEKIKISEKKQVVIDKV